MRGTSEHETDLDIGRNDIRERVEEAIGKSAKTMEWIHLVYELWQEDVIDEDTYLRYVQRMLLKGKD